MSKCTPEGRGRVEDPAKREENKGPFQVQELKREERLPVGRASSQTCGFFLYLLWAEIPQKKRNAEKEECRKTRKQR